MLSFAHSVLLVFRRCSLRRNRSQDRWTMGVRPLQWHAEGSKSMLTHDNGLRGGIPGFMRLSQNDPLLRQSAVWSIEQGQMRITGAPAVRATGALRAGPGRRTMKLCQPGSVGPSAWCSWGRAVPRIRARTLTGGFLRFGNFRKRWQSDRFPAGRYSWQKSTLSQTNGLGPEFRISVKSFFASVHRSLENPVSWLIYLKTHLLEKIIYL